jgi:hypothetical protein
MGPDLRSLSPSKDNMTINPFLRRTSAKIESVSVRQVILDYNFQDDKLLPLAKRAPWMGQSSTDLADHILIRRIYDHRNDPTKPFLSA